MLSPKAQRPNSTSSISKRTYLKSSQRLAQLFGELHVNLTRLDDVLPDLLPDDGFPALGLGGSFLSCEQSLARRELAVRAPCEGLDSVY